MLMMPEILTFSFMLIKSVYSMIESMSVLMYHLYPDFGLVDGSGRCLNTWAVPPHPQVSQLK